MEGDGCSESAFPNDPLPQFEPVDLVPVTFEEPVPEESAPEPDPDVVLENLFRNSAGTRRKSTESRRKSARNRRKTVTLPKIHPKFVTADFSNNKLCDDDVQEISSDSDGSTSNHFPPAFTGITVPSEVPVTTPKGSKNFVTVDSSQDHTDWDEPLKEDPLAGEEPFSGGGTVPNPMSDTPLVPVPQDAPLPRGIPFRYPISNGENPTENGQSTPIYATAPRGKTLYDPINTIQKVFRSVTGPPKTTNITITSALETPSTADSPTHDVKNSFTYEEDDFIEIEIKKEPIERPEVDTLQSALSSANIPPPNSSSEVPRPVSLPGGTIPFTKLSGKFPNDLVSQYTWGNKPKRKPTASSTNFAPILPRSGSISVPGGTLVPIPYNMVPGKPSNNKEGVPDTPLPFDLPNVQPGSNVVVVFMPDGKITTVPVQPMNRSLLDDGKTASTCSPAVGARPKDPLKYPLVTTPISTAKPRGRPRMVRSSGSSKTKGPNRLAAAAPLSGSWTNPNPPKAPAIPQSGSWTNPNPPEPPAIPRIHLNPNSPDQSIISDPLKLEEDPLEGPEQDLSSALQDVFSADSPNLKREENSPMMDDLSVNSKKNLTSPVDCPVFIPDNQNVLSGYDKIIDTAPSAIDNFLDEPPATSSKPPKRVQPLWPPPNIRTKRRRMQRKISQPVAEIPLSGSWTNPNPKPATVSIERDPLEGPVQNLIPWTDDYLNGRRETFHLSSHYIRRTKSTQCNAFNSSMYDVSLREAAGLETADLSRPLVSIRGYGIDVPAKQIVYNLYKYFEHRRITYNLRYLSLELTRVATGVKSGTVRRILNEAKKACPEDDFRKIPNFAPLVRRRNRVKYIFSNLKIDMALRECMIEHFLKKKESLALAFLKKKCHPVIGPKSRCKLSFVRLRIKALGFVSVRTIRRKIHVEGHAVRAWRHKYLTQINRLIEEKRNIVFTLVLNLLEYPKSAGEEWVIVESDDEIKQESRVLTVFHAANENGYLDEGFFVKDANPLNATEGNIYFEWLELNVLKKIPTGSVVVLAHQRFHDMKDIEMKPNEGCSKKQIIDWLQSKVVGEVDETLPKCVLLDKVSMIPAERGYSIDSLVETYGHTPVHLFPQQRDLNPLEYVWEDIRSKIHKQGKLRFNKNNLGSNFASNAPVFEFGWKRYKTWGNYYVKKDPLLEVAQEAAIRKLGGVWSPLITDNTDDVVDGTHDVISEENEEDELERDSAPEKSPAKSGKSESDPDSDSNSSQSDSDSDSSCSNSDDSTSSESEDDFPLSERINGNKNGERKTPS